MFQYKNNKTLPDSTRNYDISQFLQGLPQFTSTSTERSLQSKPLIQQDLEKIINLLKFKMLPFENEDKGMLQSYFEKQFPYFQKFKGSLGSEQYEQLIENLDIEEFKMKQTIFRQGETGRKMYFVLFGEVSILVKSELKHPLQNEGKIRYRGQKFEQYLETHFPSTKVIGLKKEGDYFGEIAIEQRVPRTATSVARTYCVLAVLTFHSYNQLLRSHQNDALRYKYEMVKQFEPFNLWSEQELFLLLHGCEEFQTIKGNSLIYKRYQPQKHIYLILEGEVLVQGFKTIQLDEYKDDLISHRIINISCFGRGQIFGDYEIYKGNYSAQTQTLMRITQAIAKEPTTVLIIPIYQYLQSVKENMGQQGYSDYLTNKYGTKVQWWKPKEEIQLETTNNIGKKKCNLKIDLNETNYPNFMSKGYLSPQVDIKQCSPKTVKFKKLKSMSPIKKEIQNNNQSSCQDFSRQKSDSYYQSRINSLLRRQTQIKLVYQYLESPSKFATDSSNSQYTIQIKSPKSPKSPQLSYFSSAQKRSQSIHKFLSKTKVQF